MDKADIVISFSENFDQRSQEYLSILDYATNVCNSMTFVVLPSPPLSSNGLSVREKVNPHILQVSVVKSWPGTTLLGGSARLYKLAYNRKVFSLLTTVASNLFDWMQPDLPEDLCFYRPDGSVWLTTISHERDAYLTANAIEIEKIEAKLPGLNITRCRNWSQQSGQ